MCNPLGYDRLQLSLRTYYGLALCPFLCPFVLYLATIIALTATFGLNPPEFIQATLHLLGRSSFPILAPFLLLLLSLLHLSFLRILVVVLPLFYFLVSWLTIFSRPGPAIQPLIFLVLLLAFSVLSSISGSWCTHAQPTVLFLYTTSIQGFLSPLRIAELFVVFYSSGS